MRIENALKDLRGPDVSEKRNEEVRKRRQAPKAGDVVEISTQARNLTSSPITPADVDAVSDVRQARITAVRQRVAEGFYDRPEVRGQSLMRFWTRVWSTTFRERPARSGRLGRTFSMSLMFETIASSRQSDGSRPDSMTIRQHAKRSAARSQRL